MGTLLVFVVAAEFALPGRLDGDDREVPDWPNAAVCGRCTRPRSEGPRPSTKAWLDPTKGKLIGLASGFATGATLGRSFEGGGESPGAVFRAGKPWIAWGATGALFLTNVITHAPEEPPKVTSSWRRLPPPNLIDASIRHGLPGRLSPGARQFFDGASYATLWHLLAQPVGLFATGGGRPDRWQDVLIPAEAAAVAGLATNQVKHLVHRARPFAYYCEPPDDEAIRGRDAQLSFFSGHASVAFALAAATSGVAAARGQPNAKRLRNVSYGMAGATGLFRVLADRHYATDVVVGSAVGWLTGRTLAKWHARPRAVGSGEDRPPAAISATVPLGHRGTLSASFGDGFAVRLVIVR